MSDFPGVLHRPQSLILSTVGPASMFGDNYAALGTIASAAAWGAANTAVYVPVMLEIPAAAYQMAFIVGAQAGNYDVGIYDEAGGLPNTRLVSLGSTTVPVAGIALANIADTVLKPGVLFLAMNLSTLTTLTINCYNPGGGVQTCQMHGVMTEAVGATALPATATAVTAVAPIRVPALTVALTAVI